MRLGIIRLLVSLAIIGASLALAAPNKADAAVAALDNTGSPFWISTPSGDVWNFGGAADYGDLKGQPLNKPIVGMAPTPANKGYWLAATDGGIFSYGDARFYGSTGNIRLNKPIVGMSPTPSGNGYWMVATDGGIFAYGDARFFGSTGNIKLAQPIVGMAPTPSGNGYWLVASDGGIFAFGDAQFFGSTGATRLQRPITAMAPTTSGKGYWLTASDGGIFAFGDATFYGSAGAAGENIYNKIIAAPDGRGYWLVRNGGDVIGYGSVTSDTKRPTFGMTFQNYGPGSQAVLYAMDKLGKAYVWGGNGPNGYDCSGLTSQAWKSAGVSIPRVANDQSAFGPKVGLDALRPGDLLYWGPDRSNQRSIDHVGMYVGGGWAVNAGGTGTGVNMRSVPKTSGWMFDFGTRPRG